MARTERLVWTTLLACALAGCSERSSPDNPDGSDRTGDPVLRVYEVRAVIEQLPEGEQRLMARHEAIPDFDGGDELGMGMDVMSMPFWPPMPSAEMAPAPDRVPDALALEGIEVGDVVTIRFEVQHAGEGAPASCFYALEVTELPAGTELDFGTRLPEILTFRTRAAIVELPSTDRFGLETPFKARHEAVPDFPNADGTTGMDTMIMPFWPPVTGPEGVHAQRLPEGIDLGGLRVGDAVLITWEVQVDRSTGAPLAYYALEVEALPAGTELDFTPLPR